MIEHSWRRNSPRHKEPLEVLRYPTTHPRRLQQEVRARRRKQERHQEHQVANMYVKLSKQSSPCDAASAFAAQSFADLHNPVNSATKHTQAQQ